MMARRSNKEVKDKLEDIQPEVSVEVTSDGSDNKDVSDEQKSDNITDDNITEESEPESVIRYAPERVNPTNYLSSGLTLLNLATTNNPDCFIEKGTYDLFVGQSGSGKSFLTTQILAEAANNPNFDGYELIYDDVEHGCLFDIEQMFGKKLAKRLRAPKYDESGMPIYSSTVEDFFFNIDDFQDAKKPFVYVLDSMDSLTSSASDTKFEENKNQRRIDLEKGKETSQLTQGYGDGKAKQISGNLRRVVKRLPDTGSILMIISQVRDNITGYGPKYTRSGGQALKFFAHEEFWLYNTGSLSKRLNGQDRKYGEMTRIDLVKNRITGMKSSVMFPILMGVGISNSDSCLEWLCEEGRIIRPKRSNGLYNYESFGLELNREAMIAKMEDDFEPFKNDITTTWNSILQAISCTRKRKYE